MELKYFNLSTSLLFLILALILFIKKSPNRKSNMFLGLLFVLISAYTQITYFHFHFTETRQTAALSYFLPVDGLILMLMGPTLYFFILSSLRTPLKLLRRKNIFHLLPLLPCLIFNILFCFLSTSERVNWLVDDFYHGSWQMNIVNGILYVQIIAYLYTSYKILINRHRFSPYIENNGYRTNITWMRYFLLVNLIVVLVSLPVCFIINNERTSIFIGQTAMNIDFIFLFIMSALKMGDINTEKMEEKKPARSMNTQKATNDWEILGNYMLEHKPYRDENCSLRTLALQVNIPEHQLSKILNTHGGISFSDYINDYRVKEAVILLQDKSPYRKTIDTIATDCGFGSRTTFYRVFKKTHKSTPTTYRKIFDTGQCK